MIKSCALCILSAFFYYRNSVLSLSDILVTSWSSFLHVEVMFSSSRSSRTSQRIWTPSKAIWSKSSVKDLLWPKIHGPKHGPRGSVLFFVPVRRRSGSKYESQSCSIWEFFCAVSSKLGAFPSKVIFNLPFQCSLQICPIFATISFSHCDIGDLTGVWVTDFYIGGGLYWLTELDKLLMPTTTFRLWSTTKMAGILKIKF